MMMSFFFGGLREIVTLTTSYKNENIARIISTTEQGVQMLAAYQELIIEEDVDFEQSIQWLDGNGNYINIASDPSIDFIFGFSYRDKEDVPIKKFRHTVDVDIFTVGAQGLFTISVPRAELDGINFSRAFYSIKIYYKSKWYRLLEGPVLLSTESVLIDV